MLVKVIDGCGFNGRYWVYAAATTDVAYTVTIIDSETGDSWSRSNTLGHASPRLHRHLCLLALPVTRARARGPVQPVSHGCSLKKRSAPMGALGPATPRRES